MRKVWDRVLYRDPRHFAAFPAVALLPDGQVVVLFRRARDHRWLHRRVLGQGDEAFDSVDHVDSRSQLVLLRLDENLEPAGEPEGLSPDADAADQDASLLVLRDGRLLVSGFSWYPFPAAYGPVVRGWGGGYLGSAEDTGTLFLFWGAYTRLSADGGRTWTPHRWLPGLPGHPDLVPGVRPHHGGGTRGRAVEAPDGTLLLATYAAHPEAGGRYASHLFTSANGGASWEYRSLIALDRDGTAGYAEPALHLAGDGTLTVWHRSFGLKDRLVTVTSGDLGRTWSSPTVHAVKGHPWDVIDLADGRRLAVCGYRHEPRGIRAHVWNPATQTIDDGAERVIRDDGPSRDLGYPWAVALPDGRALVVYYFCDGAGLRHIAASLLAPLSPGTNAATSPDTPPPGCG